MEIRQLPGLLLGFLEECLAPCKHTPSLGKEVSMLFKREGPQEAMQSLGALPGVFSIPHLRTFLRGVLLEHPWDYP